MIIQSYISPGIIVTPYIKKRKKKTISKEKKDNFKTKKHKKSIHKKNFN
jgi:hypothetical protein